MRGNGKCYLTWGFLAFFLQERKDPPCSVVMTPFNAGVAPTSRDLGHEIDLTATYIIDERMQLLIGYSHFFAGRYYDNPALPANEDADFVYTQFHVNF